MPDSPNITIVRRLYDSGMAPEVTAEVMAPDLVWDITPGFPNSGVYHGWDNVAKDFFGVIMPSYESFGPVPGEFFADDDNHVFVYGHYHAETKSGNKADVRFIHLWTVRDGKLVRMQQAADSHILREALNG
ncbi:nuclear transport factor 2 family protein [Streptomyces sp. NPDC097610]|uniref:nuclear transport factor 2 family protein n=1 Tax=Streptomyces sp. NPDC097610 TaxID=3157227 RepID=UPI00333269BD